VGKTVIRFGATTPLIACPIWLEMECVVFLVVLILFLDINIFICILLWGANSWDAVHVRFCCIDACCILRLLLRWYWIHPALASHRTSRRRHLKKKRKILRHSPRALGCFRLQASKVYHFAYLSSSYFTRTLISHGRYMVVWIEPLNSLPLLSQWTRPLEIVRLTMSWCV